MSNVYAFQPRTYDPPRFVAEDRDALNDLVGSFVSAEQCDGCGNGTYRIVRWSSNNFRAECAVDPTDDPEFAHTAPCGAFYRIGLYEEDRVVF